MIQFQHIYNSGAIIMENELIEHRQDARILSRYDSNFIQFKRMPSEVELTETIAYLTAFHKARGQQFVKFKFPANEVIPKALLQQLEGYDIGFLELYTLQPTNFQATATEADVRFVGEAELADFLKLQYNEDLHFGEAYATEKQSFLQLERLKEGHHQLIAYKNGQPVGSVELIETNETIEIDNFFVVATMRGQGIGSAIQKFVMNNAQQKTIILVADGQGDVREMYKKQGYVCKGFQYEALRQFEQ